MGNKKQRKIVTRLILGALILFLALMVEFVVDRYRTNRSIVFRTEGSKIQIFRDKKWKSFLVKGVNLGQEDSACAPDDMGITKQDYQRWFKQVAAMNANVIRVYDILSPEFYQAFFEYNMLTDKPVYLIQGIQADNNDVEQYKNAYDDRFNADFFARIQQTVDVVHGKALVKHGSGSYSYNLNVSPYVMGYIICGEMDAAFVKTTNEENTQVMGFEGDYLYTENASPYEAWLAAMGNYTVSYEQQKYHGLTKLLSWTDFSSADPAENAGKPGGKLKDEAAFDFEHIHAKEKFDAGFFASYNISSASPELLNNQDENAAADDNDTDVSTNPYAAYFKDLKACHTMPVLVANLGISGSGIMPDKNAVSGAGTASAEKEKGQAVANMFDSIINAGLAGGIVFSWQDEWCRKTWNIAANSSEIQEQLKETCAIVQKKFAEY